MNYPIIYYTYLIWEGTSLNYWLEPWAISHKPLMLDQLMDYSIIYYKYLVWWRTSLNYWLEPWAMSHEPSTINTRLINELFDYLLWVFGMRRNQSQHMLDPWAISHGAWAINTRLINKVFEYIWSIRIYIISIWYVGEPVSTIGLSHEPWATNNTQLINEFFENIL